MKTANRLVLHIDDDESVLKLVKQVLSKRSIKVISLTDPFKVIDTIVQEGIRVVLLDIDMPKKDGLTLLREIKSFDAGVHTIMCTGMVSISTILCATSLGAESCIFKPFYNHAQITDAVERAFQDIDRWWDALREWNQRKKQAESASRTRKSQRLAASK